ncbi:MAG: hypothetical protein IPO37_10145 [Saprospiraceae bacterium]|jgi:hypothetical protein|nr:hypothetical protein [Saprospiraceae bacterium]MBP6445248.1 hypothetical protein [Saprospiraceae bacterium]
MKNIFILLFIFGTQFSMFSQEKFEDQVKYIKRNIEIVKEQEKAALKAKIEEINQKLENKEITQAQADEMKKSEAEKSANQIALRIEPFELELRELVKGEVNEDSESKDESDSRATTLDDDDDMEKNDGDDNDKEERKGKRKRGDIKNKSDLNWDFDFDWGSRKKRRGEPITTTQFVFAFGLNNIISGHDLGTLENNGIKVSNSRFYEWGWTWKTRLTPNSAFLNLKYGLSFTYNNLRPDNNQHYIKDGNKTLLARHPFSLTDEPYFRMNNFVIPLHLEFDFSKRSKSVSEDKKDEKIVVRTQRGIRMGIGGYAGVNYRTKQILEYKNDGLRTDLETRGDFNTNDIIYGVSGYFGYRDFSLYTKYDLNTTFTDNPLKQHNISFGARFDFH